MLACAASIFFHETAGAQSGSELNTLFFDAVYAPDEEQAILLSSGQRPEQRSGESQEPGTGNSGFPAIGTDQQVTDPARILSDIADYETRIATHIGTGGTFDPALAQDYLSIGSLYQQVGNYEEANAAFENAMHIQRVNQGLFTLEQTEAVRMLIENSKATGAFEEADKYHEYLYYLQSKSLDPDDEALVAATMGWADWNLEIFRRLAFQRNSGITITGGLSSLPATQLRNRELVAIEDNMFNEVIFVPRTLFLGAGTSLRSQAYTPEQLLDPRLKNAEELYEFVLESDANNYEALTNKAGITYLFKTQLEQLVSTSAIGANLSSSKVRSMRNISVLRRGYSESREDMLEYALSMAENDPVQAANAYINLGDWDLAFDRFNRGVESYNKAREVLAEAGYDEAAITRHITPEPAIFIPGFAPHQYTRQFLNIPETADIPYIGYFDITFNKTSRGDLRNINITGSSDNASTLVRNQLLDMLRDIQARPLIVTGQAEEQADIKVRYYYSY